MKELRPKIKPKAPASLKENVLKAVSEQEIAATSRKKTPVVALRWLSAAAVVLVGILTFALWPKEKPLVAEVAKPTQTAEKRAVESPKTTETSSEKPRPASVRKKSVPKPVETPILAASAPTPLVEEAPILSAAETATETAMELTPEEQQLLAELEKKRPLVNALLAEELAQANFQQRRIRQIQQESIQKYINMQQTIRQQIRESIENIGRQPENNVREV